MDFLVEWANLVRPAGSTIAMNEIKLNEEASKRLADEVAAKGQDVHEFVSLAVLRELSRQKAEIEEIRKGLAEAEAGKFASDEEVEATFDKYDLDEEP